VVQHVRGVVSVREIADLIDHEHVRPHVRRERLAQASFSACGGEVQPRRTRSWSAAHICS
jgi:hypothetical protein